MQPSEVSLEAILSFLGDLPRRELLAAGPLRKLVAGELYGTLHVMLHRTPQHAQLNTKLCRTQQAALHAADWLAAAHVADEGSSIALKTVTAASAFQKTGGIEQETSASSRVGPAVQQAADRWRGLALQLALLLALTAEAAESHRVSCDTAWHVTQQRCEAPCHCIRISSVHQELCQGATERWVDAVMAVTA